MARYRLISPLRHASRRMHYVGLIDTTSTAEVIAIAGCLSFRHSQAATGTHTPAAGLRLTPCFRLMPRQRRQELAFQLSRY
jgi:uncharacterized membrane protein